MVGVDRNMLMLPILYRRTTKPNVRLVVPTVAGGTAPEARRAMNEAINRLSVELVREQGDPANIREMDGTFEIKTNQRGVLSLSLLNYAFTGGAHGITLQRSLTFDAGTGKRYSLGELFRPGSHYKHRLDALIRAQIQARNLPLIGEYPGIAGDQDYYVADKALVIYFPLYTLVPYARGFPYFPISVYDIQDIIDEDGPLGEMLY